MRTGARSTQSQTRDRQARQEMRQEGGRAVVVVTAAAVVAAAADFGISASDGVGSSRGGGGGSGGALRLYRCGRGRCHSCSFVLSAAIDSSTVMEGGLSSGGSRRDWAGRVSSSVGHHLHLGA